MDVVKAFLAVCCGLMVAACGADRNDSGSPQDQFIKTGTNECEGLRIQGEYLVHWKNGQTTKVISESDERFVEGFVAEKSDDIIFAEPHYQVQVDNMETLQDRGWGGDINWGPSAVEAEKFWGADTPDNSVIVAVIDSGLDIQHPELVDALYVNANEVVNGIDDDNNGYVDDINGYNFVKDVGAMEDFTGHGTHVAGVIAAQHDIGQILGVAPNVKIMPLNFIGPGGGGSILDAINAIQYAANHGAQVINASWGGNFCSLALHEEIKSLANKNILFVAAAGNSGNDISLFPEYPAAFTLDNMIVVGASTFDEKTAGFSNYGVRVDLVAPGANIYSTYPAEFDKDKSLDGVASLNGTSMATPFVAAAAALLWSMRPGASYVDIKQALNQGVRPGPYPVKTQGLLNIPGSVNALENL